jgi:hypothetical protein
MFARFRSYGTPRKGSANQAFESTRGAQWFIDEMRNQEVSGPHGGLKDINIANHLCESFNEPQSLRVLQRRERDELCYDEEASQPLEIRDENRLRRYWSIIMSAESTVGNETNQ